MAISIENAPPAITEKQQPKPGQTMKQNNYISNPGNILPELSALTLSLGLGATLGAYNALISTVPSWIFKTSVALSIILFIVTLIKSLETHTFKRKLRIDQRIICLVITILVSGAFFNQGTTPSFRHDEIYSWNLWAIQHYQGIPHDLSYTQAPYPQLFSYWQASLYGAQGGTTSQLLPRLATALPTWILVGSFFTVWAGNLSRPKMIGTGLLCLFLLIDTWHTLRLGFADPLMAATLVVSLLCLLRYNNRTDQIGWLWVSAILGGMAAMTKQPAVLWACMCLPCLTIWQIWDRRWPWGAIFPTSIGAILVFGWLTLSMPDVAKNQGVMTAAFGDRTVLDTLLTSVHRYWIDKPETLLVFLTAIFLSRHKPIIWRILLLGVFPMTALWFTLGSYEYRHGIHVTWVLGILICASLSICKLDEEHENHSPSQLINKNERTWAALTAASLCVLVGIAILWSAQTTGKSLSDGQKRAFELQFAQPEAGDFYLDAVEQQAHVWVTSNYSYGLFYNRLPLGRPDTHRTDNTPKGIQKELLSFGADYVITSSGAYAFGDYSRVLTTLIKQCENSFEKIITSHDKIFSIYKVNTNLLLACVPTS